MGLYLSQSTLLRLIAFSLLYFAQGIPIGLFTIALPAWLAANGADAADVGTMVAVTGLPWAFKLVSGPFMDRFSFPAMGRRRPWVIASQLGLCLALASLVVVGDLPEDLWLLIVIGVVTNSFAALQDVAVDGMAIEILPASERGRANALMAFGQVAGFSGFGALGGWLLADAGLVAAALVSALVVAAIVTFSTLVRERVGERLLPWSAGEANPRRHRSDGSSFRVIFRNLLRVLLLPMSLVMIGVELLSRMSAGIYVSFLPVFAVQELGYSSQAYGYWMGLTGGGAAVIGIFFGPLIDRYGARNLLTASLLGAALVAAVFGMTVSLWANTGYVLTSLIIVQIFSQGFFIAMIALFMGICWAQVAATQFAIYMSLANLSRSLGAGLYAMFAADLTSTTTFFVMAGFFVAGALMLTRYDAQAHEARLTEIEADYDRTED
jgi:MFS transporter, PAT family, beta-lactamase induction signal transducer AmpG